MKKLKIMVLFEFPDSPPQDHNYNDYFLSADWKDERDVTRTLRKMGHDVTNFGLHDNITPLVDELTKNPPDLVFNICEAFNTNRELANHLSGLMELLDIPYTGANALCLTLCQDKGMSKQILQSVGINTPDFLIVPHSGAIPSLSEITLPAMIKPLGFDGSEGISGSSLAKNASDAYKRIQYLKMKYRCDVIIEEFIPGTEFYIGVMGRERLTSFPPQEMFFANVRNKEQRFATYKVKWDEKYRKSIGATTGDSKSLSPFLKKQLAAIAKKAYKVFKINSYARLDFRLGSDGKFYLIELNANPAIAKDDEFAASVKVSGMDYSTLLGKIMSLALSNHAQILKKSA